MCSFFRVRVRVDISVVVVVRNVCRVSSVTTAVIITICSDFLQLEWISSRDI